MYMAICVNCGAKIVFVTMSNGKKMPCDEEMVLFWRGGETPDKIITANGAMLAVSLHGKPGDEAGIGYLPHWGSCSQKRADKQNG